MTVGETVKWEIPAGRRGIGVTRMPYRTQTVTIVGPVAYEPGMLRVRLSDGSVVRALREHLAPVGGK